MLRFAIALIMLTHELFFSWGMASHIRATPRLSIAWVWETIIACAACIRTVEFYETHCSSPKRSVPALLWTFVACRAVLAICGAAVMLGATVKYLLRRDGHPCNGMRVNYPSRYSNLKNVVSGKIAYGPLGVPASYRALAGSV
jgi:hypothetical protein